jgi:hypothetical protein
MVHIAIVEESVIKRGWLTLPSLKSQLLREDGFGNLDPGLGWTQKCGRVKQV